MIGTCLQNGSLFPGDVFSNIAITASWCTREDACEAARLAGIAKDIEALPVGMNTLISGGGGMIVLDKRHIAEEGTYEELKKKVYLLLK